MKELWMKPKGKALFLGAAVVVVGLIALGLFLLLSPRGYITIRIYDLDGSAQIQRQGAGVIDAYINMLLESGDRGTTDEDSWLYLLVDDDKYILAEPETTFSIQANGNKENSRISLDLENGTLINHITRPLNENSTYELSTPSSTMAVRGTSYQVEAWVDEDGVAHTKIQVFDGIVEIHLIYPDGSISEDGYLLEPGQTLMIWGDDTTTEYEFFEDSIDYYSLKTPALEFLKIGIENLENYDITIVDVDEIIGLQQTYFEVRFMSDGQLFATQTVLFDQYAHEPVLQPEPNGHWSFNFETPIREDTEIQWVSE